jgi:hypothetical protein
VLVAAYCSRVVALSTSTATSGSGVVTAVVATDATVQAALPYKAVAPRCTVQLQLRQHYQPYKLVTQNYTKVHNGSIHSSSTLWYFASSIKLHSIGTAVHIQYSVMCVQQYSLGRYWIAS